MGEVSRVVKYLKTSNNILKNDINEVIYKTETGSQILKKKTKNLWLRKWGRRGKYGAWN